MRLLIQSIPTLYMLLVAICILFTWTAEASYAQESNKERLEMKSLPDAVQKTIKRESFRGRIIEVEKESDGTTYFEAEVVIGKYIYDVAVNKKGLLLAKTMDRPLSREKDDDDEEGEGDKGGKDGDDEDGDDEDGDDEDGDDEDGDDEDGDDEDSAAVKLNDLPRNVRLTLERETKEGSIEDLEREKENGKTIYSADVEYATDFGNLEYEIEISDEGILLHKVLEEVEKEKDDEEDDGDENDDEDDDKDDGDDGK